MKISMCKTFEDHYRSGMRAGERRGERRGKRKENDRIMMAFIRASLAEGQTAQEVEEKLRRYFALSPERVKSCMSMLK